MTKKFWADWQKRIGETKNIAIFFKESRNGYFHWLFRQMNGDHLVRASFHGDVVDLIIERHNRVIDWNTHSLKQHVENEYTTLHRNEIASIKFKHY